MAKTMIHKKTKEVKRVSNQEAKQLHKSGQWDYISKYEGKRLLANQSEGDQSNG